MTFSDVMSRIRGPALVVVTILLLGQGQLFLGVVVGWTAFDTIRADTWIMGKLAALIASINRKDPQ